MSHTYSRLEQCTLYAFGPQFDPEWYLLKNEIPHDEVWYLKTKSFSYYCSNGLAVYLASEESSIHQQEKHAISYIKQYKTELKRLATFPEVHEFILGLKFITSRVEPFDFSIPFSNELLELVAEIGIELKLHCSVVKISEDGTMIDRKTALRERIQANREAYNPDEQPTLPEILASIGFIFPAGMNDEGLDDQTEKLRKLLKLYFEPLSKDLPKVKRLSLIAYDYLDPSESNCFRCEKCGRWATDYEKPHEIKTLPSGCEYEGMLVCDECRCWKHDPQYGWWP